MPLTTADREEVAHHGLPVAEVVLIAETDEAAGLSTEQWRERLAALGPNELPAQRGPGWVVRLLQQLHHPLIYVLLVAAGITFALGEVVDASVVLGVVVINAVIGFVQEARAEKALDALVSMVRTEVTVVRDGLTARVPSAQLVPGDVVLLDAGDQVGADLPTNMAEGLVILTAILLAAALPILPVQILWINMTTAVALGLTLAFEPREPGVMQRPPLPPSLPLLTRSLFGRILFVSAILLACSLGAFRWQLLAGASLEVARTVAVNVFVGAQIAYLVNCRSLERVRPRTGPNRWLLVGIGLTIALQLALTYVPFMNDLFHTAPLGWQPWLAVLALSAVSYVLVELDKWRRRRWRA